MFEVRFRPVKGTGVPHEYTRSVKFSIDDEGVWYFTQGSPREAGATFESERDARMAILALSRKPSKRSGAFEIVPVPA